MGRIWVIASYTVREALRMKVVLAFAVLIVVLVLTLPFAVRRADATVSSTVQAFLSWSLRPTATLLSFLALFLGCLSISDEMVNRQIYTLVSKPLPRWQYIVGKWLGTVAVLSGLLLFAGLASYLMAHYLASKPNPDEIDARKLKHEVLVARGSAPLVVPDYTADARKRYQFLVDEGRITKSGEDARAKTIEKLRRGMVQQWRTVPPGAMRAFEFKGIKKAFLSEDDELQLRYKAKGLGYAQDETLWTVWVFGDYTKARQSRQIPRRDVMERYHTISFKASAVAADGTLQVGVINADHMRPPPHRGATIAFEAEEGFEVLYVIGPFISNLLRALFLIWCRVSLVAAVAVCSATLVSYPVACLMTFLFYVMAVVGDFVKDALSFGKKGEGPLGLAQYLMEPLLDFLFWLWPNFREYDAIETFVDGRNVSLTWDLQGFANLVLLLSTVFLITGCIIFRRRQVAELSI